MAPTTERDFYMLPEEKQRIYREIRTDHIHGSPDGPWFFIVGRSENGGEQLHLLGITDTSMLRPQVFALQEGAVKIGLIASERQAIDACLRSLAASDQRFAAKADRYWNARGGSYTDGGTFMFTVDRASGTPQLRCVDKFGREVAPPQETVGEFLDVLRQLAPQNIANAIPDGRDESAFKGLLANLTKTGPGTRHRVRGMQETPSTLSGADHRQTKHFAERGPPLGGGGSAVDRGAQSFHALAWVLDNLHRLPGGQRGWIKAEVEAALFSVLRGFPRIGEAGSSSWVLIDSRTMGGLKPPRGEADVLLLDISGFPAEGENSASAAIVAAYNKGWKQVVSFDWRGQRFCGAGLGPHSEGFRLDVFGNPGDYLGSGLDGGEICVHGAAQDQVAQIMKSGKLVIYGDVGQTFMYAAKGGEVYVLGNAAGRPLINAVGSPKVVINGTCLDYLAESFMAGNPLDGGGFVVVNGLHFNRGEAHELETPYSGGNLFSLASGGAVYIRDPAGKVGVDQLNGGQLVAVTENDWRLIHPHLLENEKLFGIRTEDILTTGSQVMDPSRVYRKVQATPLKALATHG